MSSEAQVASINTELPVEYGITDAALSLLREKHKGLRIVDAATYKAVVVAIAETRGLRVSVEKKRVELKAEALAWGRKVDGEARRITTALEEIEEPLKAEKQRVDDEKEQIRAEKEAAERERILAEERRVNGIRARMDEMFGPAAELALHNMTAAELVEGLADVPEIGEEFEEFRGEAETRQAQFLAKAQGLLTAKQAREAEAERQRIEAARLAEERRIFEAEQAAERARVDKAIAERLARETAEEATRKAEANRLEAERKAFDEARRVEQEKVADELAASRTALEAERLALEEAKRLEAAKKEAAEKAVREAEEKAKRDAEAKAEADRLAAEEAARQEALRPDKEKLREFAASLLSLAHPEVSSEAAKEILDDAGKRLLVLSSSIMRAVAVMA